MAKCFGSITRWEPKEKDPGHLDFLVADVRSGERQLARRLEDLNDLILGIAIDYIQIRQSASSDNCQADCQQIQDALQDKLKELNTQTCSVMKRIITSELISSTKHRYFIVLACGTIDNLKQLLQTVGRLSELNQDIFMEEQRKPLVSDHSITIHCLTTIWLASVEMMVNIQRSAEELFKKKDQADSVDDSDDHYDFVSSLEFSTESIHYAQVLLMDLTNSSWIQFNRLVKLEDLIRALPFLCPCNVKMYFQTLRLASKARSDAQTLPGLLSCIIDQDRNPSVVTHSLRRYGVLPVEPCYSGSSDQDLAYFIIWHIYSLSRVASSADLDLILACQPIIEQRLPLALGQFSATSQSHENRCLSPHQRERFQLLFVILNFWCEKARPKRDVNQLVGLVLSFIEQHWDFLGTKYFDNNDLRVEGLTLFQLFTKLTNEANLMPTNLDCQAERQLTASEKKLDELWGRVLARLQTQTIAPPAAKGSDKQATN